MRRKKLTAMQYVVFSFFILSAICCNTTNEQKEKIHTRKRDSILENIIYQPADSIIFSETMKWAAQKHLYKENMGELVLACGKKFLNIPYVGKTLDTQIDEQLIINLRELDCTTFLENMLAFASVVKSKELSFANFCRKLIAFRYRNGTINEYPSRLHYFSDWLHDNQKLGLISIVSETFAHDDWNRKVDFMTSHAHYYKPLKNPKFITEIAKSEKEISKRKFKYIPAAKIKNKETNIQNGDIIAITTNVQGLDIAHVGFAIRKNNRVHLMHASSAAKKVIVSEKPLAEYIAGIKRQDGIIVARLK